MPAVIRLTRIGRKKSPAYRIVVADSRRARDGRVIEILGHYQPLMETPAVEIDEEKALKWLMVGAKPERHRALHLPQASHSGEVPQDAKTGKTPNFRLIPAFGPACRFLAIC